MFQADTCRERRRRLLAELPPRTQPLCLTHPVYLAYLAGFWVDPISLGSPFGGVLVLQPDGAACLIHENRLPASVQQAQVDERIVVDWYDGQSPGRGPRELAALREALRRFPGLDPADRVGHPEAETVATVLARHRRRKDTEELALLQRCMQATAAGHSWAIAQVRPGMTELDVYSGIAAACQREAGQPVIVYGDFAVSPGPERRGGPPTQRVIQKGDMLILDFSVVIQGYRSDFTNTLVVGGAPSEPQQRLYNLCCEAMQAGERELRAGVACQTVYNAVRAAFEPSGLADAFPHHAGHGLGLTHPEAPFIVRNSTETLEVDDVITLEPGLYVAGVGGIRIEHNYRITETGFERLSPHMILL